MKPRQEGWEKKFNAGTQESRKEIMRMRERMRPFDHSTSSRQPGLRVKIRSFSNLELRKAGMRL